MARKMKRPYFAQNSRQHSDHKSKHFATAEEARVWLRENGGGTIKHMPSAYREVDKRTRDYSQAQITDSDLLQGIDKEDFIEYVAEGITEP
jgi:hypothetical protein